MEKVVQKLDERNGFYLWPTRPYPLLLPILVFRNCAYLQQGKMLALLFAYYFWIMNQQIKDHCSSQTRAKATTSVLQHYRNK